MEHEFIAYHGWERCLRLTNGIIDLVLTTEVGPRLIRFGFVEDDNEFAEFPDQMGLTGGEDWRIYGGHRLWHSPEMFPRTYFPDNAPVTVQFNEDFVRVIQPVETTTGIQKELDLRLEEQAARVTVTHRLRNTGLWPVELAPWALSVMAPGGTAILPMPPRATHSENISPANTLTMWAYTDFSDSRWVFGAQFILLNHDSQAGAPQKIGASVPDGWAAFARDGHLFLKQVPYQSGANYPDGGCSFEIFTNALMTELETLGPLARLEPGGAAVEHVETWDLLKDIPQPANEADVLQSVLPAVKPLLGRSA